MTDSTTTTRVSYTGDGSSTNFTITFPFYLSTDILVQLAGATVTSGYSISGGNGSTGTLTMATAPVAGVNVQAILNPPLTQSVNLVDGTAFPSTTLNQVNDRAVQIGLRLQDQINRTIRAPDGDAAPVMLLPTAANRANKALMLDSNGNITTGVPNTQVITTSLLAPFLSLQQTAAEISAGVTPTNVAYPPGSFQRYGMDGTGVIACDTAFANACICNAEVFDSYPGGGTYLFNTGVTINGTYPLRIRGQTRWFLGNTGNVGTKFILGSSAGSGAALLKFTGGPLYTIEIVGIGFNCQNSTLGQLYINPQTDARGWVIERCFFFAPSNAANNTTAIQFQGAATYSGATTIRDNFFDSVNVGIVLTGICTTFKITNNEFIGYSTGVASGNAIQLGSQVQGNPIIMGNYMEGWSNGILSTGVQMVQIGNSYAVCPTPFNWVSATAKGMSIGELLLSGTGAPIYALTDAAGNFVWGAGSFMAASNLTTTRTYTEGNGTAARSFAMGYPQAVAFSAGNFTGNGAMTWTVVGGGQVVYKYAITGKTLTVWFNISGTVGGTPNTAVQIAIPGGFSAGADSSPGSCQITNGGSTIATACQANANASVFQIYANPAGTVNFTAGTVQASGQIQMQVA